MKRKREKAKECKNAQFPSIVAILYRVTKKIYPKKHEDCLAFQTRSSFFDRFIFKGLMTVMPVTILTSIMVIFFLWASWSFRICEYEVSDVRDSTWRVRLRMDKLSGTEWSMTVLILMGSFDIKEQMTSIQTGRWTDALSLLFVLNIDYYTFTCSFVLILI